MSGLPPTYTEALSVALGENPVTPFPAKAPYPIEAGQVFVNLPLQANAPQPETCPLQLQEQNLPIQQPYMHIQQPYTPTQQSYVPPQPYPAPYPQCYVPAAPGTPGYPPIQPVYPQPQPANLAKNQDVRFTGGSNSFVGIIAFSFIAMVCFLPFGMASLALAILAYKTFVRDSKESKRALALARIATALGISSIILGIFTTIAVFIWASIINAVTQ